MTDAAAPSDDRSPANRGPLARAVDVAGAYSWRLVGIALVVVGVVWLTGQLLVVLVPVAVAALLTRALMPVHRRLRRADLKPGLAATVAVLGFLVVLAAVLGFVGWSVAGEISELGPTLSEGLDDIERWIVEDGPFDVSQADVDEWRATAGDALSSFMQAGGGDSVVSGALLAGEVVIGGVLALIVTFFMLKDGRRGVDAVIARMSPGRRDVTRRAALRAWEAAGGYLRGAALLGLVESVIIGLTLLLVGADLVVAVMLITFLAAFIPIVGAVAAGIVGVLVALATAGIVPAAIVAAVAIVVQQLDNDLLAPVVYGRALQLHPLVILLGIAAGGSLFGFVGTFFAVPVLAVTINAAHEARRPTDDGGELESAEVVETGTREPVTGSAGGRPSCP